MTRVAVYEVSAAQVSSGNSRIAYWLRRLFGHRVIRHCFYSYNYCSRQENLVCTLILCCCFCCFFLHHRKKMLHLRRVKPNSLRITTGKKKTQTVYFLLIMWETTDKTRPLASRQVKSSGIICLWLILRVAFSDGAADKTAGPPQEKEQQKKRKKRSFWKLFDCFRVILTKSNTSHASF